MMNRYLVISRCEDESHLQYMNEAEVATALNDEWRDYKTVEEDQLLKNQYSFLEHFPSNSVLIMYGKLCQKQAVEKVVEWKLV